ncbi:MAG: TlpA family protein disulfide reductase [Rhodobacteraceae bacterium]|nr:TlpA family protein disulfide reductase [Paracoccaceae bacterium]
MLRPALILAAALLAPALTLTPALADFDRAAVEALRDGHMKKLMFHEVPQPVPDTVFADIDGVESSLAAYEGKIVVLNFWATWCAPCRKEMPSLDRLNMALGGEDFAVVTLATGRNSPQGMRRFFEEESIETLPLYKDPNQAIAREMAVLGLPITVILNREGQEIARLRGDAEWDSDSAKAIVAALIGGES